MLSLVSSEGCTLCYGNSTELHCSLKSGAKNLDQKFPATTPGRSMVKINRLDDAFLDVF